MATPIGNLSDLSERAAQTLRSVDVVACEDTRVSRVLLRHVGSDAKTISAHEHNQRKAAEAVLAHLEAGRSVALVSDAGTPAISDPGTVIVAAVHEAGHPVVPIPGPSAVAALLSCAGLSDAPFLFEGFLPARAKARDARLAVVQAAADSIGAIVVLHEAPHRIEATLRALADAVRRDAHGGDRTRADEDLRGGLSGPGERSARLARGAPASGCAASSSSRSTAPARTPRGRARAPRRRPPAPSSPTPCSHDCSQDLSPSRAVKLAQELTGLAHRDLYARALSLSAKARAEGAEDRRRGVASESPRRA